MRVIIILISFTFLSFSSFAQGWVRYYPGPGSTNYEFVSIVTDYLRDRIFVLGNAYTYNGSQIDSQGVLLMTLSASGDVISTKTFYEGNRFSATDFVMDYNSRSAYIAGTAIGANGSDGLFLEIDSFGNEIRRYTMNIMQYDTVVDVESGYGFEILINSHSDSLPQPVSYFTQPYASVTPTQLARFSVSLNRTSPTYKYILHTQSYSGYALGTQYNWTRALPDPSGNCRALVMDVPYHTHFMVSGIDSADMYHFHGEANGDSVYFITTTNHEWMRPVDLDGFITLGEWDKTKNPAETNDFFLQSNTYFSAAQWVRKYDMGDSVHCADVVNLGSYGNLMAGSQTFNGKTFGMLILADSAGNIYNGLNSNVWNDNDGDCIKDAGDTSVPYIMVEIVSIIDTISDTTRYFSNLQGQVQFNAVPASYSVQPRLHNSYWKSPACSVLPVSSVFTDDFDTINVSLPLKPDIVCPQMRVEISSPGLQRCFPSTYNVSYCNQGTADAQNAVVKIGFDPYLHVQGSSFPWSTIQGNEYTFNLGDVDAGHCGNFTIEVEVDCDSSVAGMTHCVSAHIYPDTICFPEDPAWDHSSIELKGDCSAGADSIFFQIINTGTGNMQAPQAYYLIRNDDLHLTGSYSLAAGQAETFAIPSDGFTWTLTTSQSEGHPGNSNPLISIEGCGTDGSGHISTNYKNQFPADESDYFTAIDCQSNTSKWLYRNLYSTPQGVGPSHYISDIQEIDYRIIFQNTGSDTVNNVIVRDTLSRLVDVLSFHQGVSSHPYTFVITNGNVLQWSFKNIVLPDSTTNEPASSGYVTFRVSQKTGNQPGDTIKNKARIYYDKTDSVFTNSVYHIITDDYKQWLNIESAGNPIHGVLVYPVPAKDHLVIELLEPVTEAHFSIYDITGRKIRGYNINGTNKFVIDCPDVVPGVYIYRVDCGSGNITSGKLVFY